MEPLILISINFDFEKFNSSNNGGGKREDKGMGKFPQQLLSKGKALAWGGVFKLPDPNLA